MTFPLRGATAVVGIGETPYHKRGKAPLDEDGLRLQAIVEACEDAGVDPADVDGFSTYGHDADATALAPALGTRRLRWASQVAGGGGGGLGAALLHGATALAMGQARYVIVYRALAQQQSGRLSAAVSSYFFDEHYRAHGLVSPAQVCALRTQRMIEHDGVPAEALRAFAQACYVHAGRNPLAAGRDVRLTDETYLSSRMISEPLRLFDSSRENDGAGAVLLTTAERARDLRQTPAYVLSGAQGAGEDWGELHENDRDYSSAGLAPLADELWADAGIRPEQVDVAQIYENFTGPAVAVMLDLGLVTRENIGELLTVENLTAPGGRLPVNTAGGNIAGGFVHGIGLAAEAVRQLRGTSSNQVPGARVSLLTGGPAAPLVSAVVLGGEDTL
ncbi:transporter [Streptomyces viridosporus]|uniref:thiolase C-terminal domain-containing protein n=1 Tax=Streptomyces TaxID=1883 RepID=UPI000D681F96|nr:transporter [Streptomyces sp. NWU49]PWJ02251.1 transporter [Streptomyces sp. NWU49]